jgi:hypothetical protein
MIRRWPLLRGLYTVERTDIVIRTDRLGLKARDRLRADGVFRRLWPGLVPIPRRAWEVRRHALNG